MASTQEILDEAAALGKKLAEHDAAKRLTSSIEKLQNDVTAQRALTDYQRFAASLMQKEAQGQPIEVDDKKKLEDMQNAVVHSLVLQEYQMAHMDYLDLLRQVDEKLVGDLGAQVGASGAAQSATVNPDLSGGLQV